MLGNRNVLAADESTANLDLINARAFFNCLKKLCENNSITVIAVTHDLLLANEFGDHFYCASNGVVKALEITETDSTKRLDYLRNLSLKEARTLTIPFASLRLTQLPLHAAAETFRAADSVTGCRGSGSSSPSPCCCSRRWTATTSSPNSNSASASSSLTPPAPAI